MQKVKVNELNRCSSSYLGRTNNHSRGKMEYKVGATETKEQQKKSMWNHKQRKHMMES